MNVSTTIPTVQIRRSRLFGLIGAVAVLAAVITWALLAFAVNTGSENAQAGATSVTANSGTAALSAQEQSALNPVGSVTSVQLRSVGYHVFGASKPLTPSQLQSVRNYYFGASLTPAALRSVGYYVFGASKSLTPSQLQSVGNYYFGASAASGLAARGG